MPLGRCLFTFDHSVAASISAVAFFPPEKRLLASGTIDGKVRIWNLVPGGGLVRELPTQGVDVTDLAVTRLPSGITLLACSSSDRTVFICLFGYFFYS